MTKQNPIRIVGAIVSLIVGLACVAGMVWAVFIPSAMMFVTCLLLALVFGYFIYADYLKFFGKDSVPKSPSQK